MKIKSDLTPFLIPGIFMFMFCLANQLTAQRLDVNYFFRHITVEDGLAHTDATALVQDNNGFLWFGTNAGLQRYDGVKLTTYWNDESVLGAVYNNRVRSLSVDAEGKLWIASEGGLKLFDTRVNSYTSIEAKDEQDAAILSQPLTQVFALSTTEVLLLHKKGLYRFEIENGQVVDQNILHILDLAEGFAGDISKSTNGDIWAVCGDLAIHVPSNTIKERNGGIRLRIVDQLGENVGSLQSIYIQENALIIGSRNGYIEVDSIDLRKFQASGVFHQFPAELSSNPINVVGIVRDGKNNLWMGSNEGLIHVTHVNDKKTYKILQNEEYNTNSLISNHINSIYKDQSENLWIGTYNGGVSHIDLEQGWFSLLRRTPGLRNTLSDNFVRAVTSDEDGNLWLGTWEGGLNKYNISTGIYTHYTTANSTILQDKIRSVAIDKEDKVWVGTSNGLTVLDQITNRFTRIEDDQKILNSSSIYTLGVDFYGNIWAGTWNGHGLFRISQQAGYQIKQYTEESISLCSDRITFIYADQEAPQLFVGTNKGLNHILLDEKGDILSVFQYKGYESDPTSLTSNFVWPIAKENDSTVWVGTLGGGLNKVTIYGDGRYMSKSYGIEYGAPSNDIETIEIDNDGKVWIGSKGLSVFDPASETFTNYDYDDGLQGNSFKIGSSHKDARGNLYFGGIHGLNHFNPEQIIQKDKSFPIAFTDLYINSRQINPGSSYDGKTILEENINLTERIELNYDQNDINLFFAVLDFSNSNKTAYRYKMIGIDDEWNKMTVEGDGRATYLNLSSGNYTLAIESALRNGKWSGNTKNLEIKIFPPIWNTIWAQMIYVLLGIAALFGVFQIQKRWFQLKKDLEITVLEETKMEELHQMRLKFFTNISHEFKTPLTLILSPIERLLTTNLAEDEKQKLYQLIHSNATRLLNLITELMDFRKVETGATKLRVQKGDIKQKVKGLVLGFEDFAERRGLKLKYSIDVEDLKDFWYDDKVVEKIVMNLLSNAFNYSEVGSVKVELFDNPKVRESAFSNSHQVLHDDVFDKYLYIKVKDSGIGITKASLQQIFDRYYRISDSNNKHLGSGVGLALVKSLVMLHKGQIYVNSERKVGSEFIIALPIGGDMYAAEEKVGHLVTGSSTSEESTSETTSSESGTQKPVEVDKSLPTILLVDDNKELLFFLKGSLEAKYNILEAFNGEEALRQIHEHVPDLIISDIMMPVMDGMQLCENVKADVNYSHIPFILLTAKGGDDSKLAGTSVGADAYFSKPFNLELLQGSIENILESRRQLKNRYKNDTFVEEREMVSNKKDKEFMDQLLKIVNDNIDDPSFDIDHLCMELGNSRTKLYNKIRSLTDLSVGEFIRRMRLKRAAEVLLKEDVSVYEVMMRVGIQSQSYFTKAFRKEFGVTPAQYKNKILSEADEEN